MDKSTALDPSSASQISREHCQKTNHCWSLIFFFSLAPISLSLSFSYSRLDVISLLVIFHARLTALKLICSSSPSKKILSKESVGRRRRPRRQWRCFNSSHLISRTVCCENYQIRGRTCYWQMCFGGGVAITIIEWGWRFCFRFFSKLVALCYLNDAKCFIWWFPWFCLLSYLIDCRLLFGRV